MAAFGLPLALVVWCAAADNRRGDHAFRASEGQDDLMNLHPHRDMFSMPSDMSEGDYASINDGLENHRRVFSLVERRWLSPEESRSANEQKRIEAQKAAKASSLIMAKAKSKFVGAVVGGIGSMLNDMANIFGGAVQALVTLKEVMPGDYPYMCICAPPEIRMYEDGAQEIIASDEHDPLCPIDKFAFACYVRKEDKQKLVDMQMQMPPPGASFEEMQSQETTGSHSATQKIQHLGQQLWDRVKPASSSRPVGPKSKFPDAVIDLKAHAGKDLAKIREEEQTERIKAELKILEAEMEMSTAAKMLRAARRVAVFVAKLTMAVACLVSVFMVFRRRRVVGK